MWVWEFLHSTFPDCLLAGFFSETAECVAEGESD